jgi:uncharacterized phage protein gp47/JayE
MDFNKSVDSIQNDLITAHFNKSGKTPGVVLQTMYSAVAVCVWGLYQYGKYILRQIIPDTADTYWLEAHANVRGISRESEETDADLLNRYSDDIQHPRSGGNAADWARWVKEVSYTHDAGLETEWVETVTDVVVAENSRGPGTINLVVVSNRTEEGFEEIPSVELFAAITTHITAQRPLGIWDVVLYAAARDYATINIDITATDFDAVSTAIEQALTDYLKTLLPGQVLTIAAIVAVAYNTGATDVVVNTPAENFAPDNGPSSYGRVWPYSVTVGEI